jgi:phage repressor protein C with HTH and peptisase S24 domain
MIYDQITSSLEDPTMRYVGLTYIPDVNGSCGGGCTFADISEYEIARFPWYMVEFLKETSKLDNIHIINVIGDSMEPKLYDKDKVFVDTSKTEINDKDMFVVSTPDGIFIKMITVKENKITLVSLNDLYFNEEIDYEIKILGTVVGKI